MAKSLYVKIIGDTSSYSRALGTAGRDTQTFGGKMGGLGRSAAIAAGGAGLTALTLAAKIGVTELLAHQKVAAQTDAVLKSTGGSANVTAKEIESLAGSIMKKTGIDDEAIQSGENLLLTFTGIRNEAGKGNDIFNQSTLAITDMSVALGQDMKSSAIQVGKALNDPIKGVTALQRVGVSFTKAQKEQIKAMVESGNVMGAQKLILAELNKEFGGSAVAAGKTLPGQLNILKERFNNLAGEGVAVLIKELQGLRPIFEAIGKVIAGLLPIIKPVAKYLFDNIVAPFKVVAALITGDWAAAWDALKAPVQDAIAVVRAIVAPLGHLFDAIMPTLTAGWDTAWAAISGTASSVWGGIQSTLEGIWNGLAGTAATVYDGIASSVTGAWDAIGSSTSTVWNAANSLVTGIWNGLSALAGTVFGAINTAVTTAWNAINALTTTVWNAIKTLITTTLTTLQTTATTVTGAIKTAITTAWNGIKIVTDTVWNGIKTVITTAINTAKTVVTTAVNAIKSVASFAGLRGIVTGEWNGIKTAITTAINAAKTVVLGAAKAIKGAINDTFDAFAKIPGAIKRLLIAPINGAIDLINGIRIPGFNISIPVPFAPDINFGWGGASPFHIPHLAEGGIVMKPTLALLGEKGPEKVTPLTGRDARPSGMVVNVTHNGTLVGSDGMAEFADVIYRELARKAGRNTRLGLA